MDRWSCESGTMHELDQLVDLQTHDRETCKQKNFEACEGRVAKMLMKEDKGIKHVYQWMLA